MKQFSQLIYNNYYAYAFAHYACIGYACKKTCINSQAEISTQNSQAKRQYKLFTDRSFQKHEPQLDHVARQKHALTFFESDETYNTHEQYAIL